MTPVISPWVFYAIGVSEKISGVFEVATFVFGLALFGHLLWHALELEAPKMALVKKLTIGFVGSFLLMSFIPKPDTITKMIVAQNVTYECVEVATDTVKSVYEDIMSLFEEGNDGT